MSYSPGLVDFAVKLAESVEQLKFLGKIFQEIKRIELLRDVTFWG